MSLLKKQITIEYEIEIVELLNIIWMKLLKELSIIMELLNQNRNTKHL